MNTLYKSNDRATVCANKNCVTVYGNTARAVNSIVLFTVVIIAITFIAKAIK